MVHIFQNCNVAMVTRRQCICVCCLERMRIGLNGKSNMFGNILIIIKWTTYVHIWHVKHFFHHAFVLIHLTTIPFALIWLKFIGKYMNLLLEMTVGIIIARIACNLNSHKCDKHQNQFVLNGNFHQLIANA